MAVKVLVWAMILGGLGIGSFWMFNEMTRDSGELVGYAITEDSPPQIHIAVPMLITKMDGPDIDAYGTPQWDAWLVQHYEIKDAQGNVVPLTRKGLHTSAIREREAGTSEFIAGGDLVAGQTYTFTFTPNSSEPKKYAKQITAAPKPFLKENFEPAY